MAYDEDKARTDALTKARDMLAEAGFDAVLLMGTWTREADGNSVMEPCGLGNWYAQVGMAREFIVKGEEFTRIHARQLSESDEGPVDEFEPPPPEED